MSETAPVSFEGKLGRIDEIVSELESGKVALDRAIALFKEGKALVRACDGDLRSAQESIEAANNEPTSGG